MSKIKEELLGVCYLDRIKNIDIILCPQRHSASGGFQSSSVLRGHWKIKAKNLRWKSRYHKCLWTIYNVRRISSSNSINDNERNGLKWASFICQKRNHFLVCLRIDLMCCSDVTEIWSVIQQKQKFFNRTKKERKMNYPFITL